MDFSFLISGILSITWQQAVMYVVGAVLIYLAIEKGFEPSLLMPMASAPSWSTCPCPALSTRSVRAWRDPRHHRLAV